MNKVDKREFKTLGSISVTNSTELFLSACYEGETFKGYYLSKCYTIKDAEDKSKIVKQFAKGAFRIDTLKQLEDLGTLIQETIKKEK